LSRFKPASAGQGITVPSIETFKFNVCSLFECVMHVCDAYIVNVNIIQNVCSVFMKLKINSMLLEINPSWPFSTSCLQQYQHGSQETCYMETILKPLCIKFWNVI